MGKKGIGKRIKGKRGEFVLNSITSSGRTIYTDRERLIKMPDIEELHYSPKMEDLRTISIIIETPLRLKSQNRLISALPFHILVRAMLRRMSSLLICYGNESPEINHTELLKLAENIKIADSNLRWSEYRRYSNRQKRAMLIGGIIGSVTYSGELSPFIGLIDFCSKVHIGKQTSFGFGKFRVIKNP